MSPARLPQRGPVPALITGRMSPVLRSRIENAIETLLAALDAADLDSDLEDGVDDEQTFGWCERGPGAQLVEPPMLFDEAEPTGDDEPSLGSLGGCAGAAVADQRSWAGGGGDDIEEEDEHGGDMLDEPSLGAPEIHHDQRRWGQGHQGSRELDHDERNDLIRDWEQEQAIAIARHEAEMLLRRHKPPQPAAPGIIPFPLRRAS